MADDSQTTISIIDDRIISNGETLDLSGNRLPAASNRPAWIDAMIDAMIDILAAWEIVGKKVPHHVCPEWEDFEFAQGIRARRALADALGLSDWSEVHALVRQRKEVLQHG